MPPILNPLPDGVEEKKADAAADAGPSTKPTPTAAAGKPNPAEVLDSRGKPRDPKDMVSGASSANGEPEAPAFRNDLDQFPFEDLQVEKLHIYTVPARQKSEFTDPY